MSTSTMIEFRDEPYGDFSGWTIETINPRWMLSWGFVNAEDRESETFDDIGDALEAVAVLRVRIDDPYDPLERMTLGRLA